MAQYINKSAVVAEINKLTKKNELYLDENTSDIVRFQKTGAYSVLCDLRHFLDTLEVKEVEEKHVSEYLNTESMIESYKQRLILQANGMKNSVLVDMCLDSYKHGVNETLDTLKLSNLVRIGK